MFCFVNTFTSIYSNWNTSKKCLMPDKVVISPIVHCVLYNSQLGPASRTPTPPRKTLKIKVFTHNIYSLNCSTNSKWELEVTLKRGNLKITHFYFDYNVSITFTFHVRVTIWWIKLTILWLWIVFILYWSILPIDFFVCARIICFPAEFMLCIWQRPGFCLPQAISQSPNSQTNMPTRCLSKLSWGSGMRKVILSTWHTHNWFPSWPLKRCWSGLMMTGILRI